MEQKLSQEIIDAAPEGAEFWRPSALCEGGMYVKRDGHGHGYLGKLHPRYKPCDKWQFIGAGISPEWIPLPTPVSDSAPDDWRPMSERPTRAGVIELRGAREPHYSAVNGNGLRGWTTSSRGCAVGPDDCAWNFDTDPQYDFYTGWRYADPTPSHAPSVSDKAAESRCFYCGCHGEAHGTECPELVTLSDQEGIASFHPPAEVSAQEKPQRVSTRETEWAWLGRFR